MASGAAKRYTEPWSATAGKREGLVSGHRNLTGWVVLCSETGAALVLNSPKISRAQKMSLIEETLRRAQPESLNLATLLLDRGRLGIAPEMAELFRDAALSELGIVVARVTTAEPIDPQTEAGIRQRLNSLVGKQVEIRSEVDPSIIGGVVARIGDQLIDGSVSNQLRRLRTRLEAGA